MAFGFFSPEEVASPAQMALRQRIALQMLANSRRSGYPKNLGEGLAAIGDAIGERGQIKSLEEQMKAYEDAKKAEKSQSDTETPTPGAKVSDSGDIPIRTATADDKPLSRQVANDATQQTPIVPPEPPPPQTAMVSPPPQISPMQQQAALTPTEQPQAFFPSTPQTASSAPPSQLALSPPPRPNEMVMRNPIPAMRDTAFAYDMMPPVRAGGPRSELAGPMNDAQSAQMAELMGRPPQGGQASPYPATASLDQGAGVNPMRNSITQALMTAQGVPQPNPTIGAATPPTTPVDTGIRAAPPVQLAQAGPAYQGPNLGPLGRQVPLPPDNQMPPSVPPSGTPATPIPPAPEEPRAFVPPSAAKPLPEPAVPPRVLPSPGQLEMERRARSAEDQDMKTYYSDKAAKFEADRAAQDTRNMDKWKADHQAWEADRARLHQYYLDTPTREQTIKKGMDEAQQRERNQKIEAQLGGIPTATWLENLKTGKEQTAGIPAATQSIKRARDLVENNKMFFGTFADTNTTLAKVMGAAGFPLDPKASGTEQFRQAMSGVMSQARKAITGPGTTSDRDMDILKAATAADARLTPESIKGALDAAERLNLTMALQHQKEVRQFAGEDDPNRQASVYRAYGVPNMADLVPQASVNKLFKFSTDPQVHKDFDDTYHTPGLSREVLRFRRPQ